MLRRVRSGLSAGLRRLLIERAPRFALLHLDLDRAELGRAGEALAARHFVAAGGRCVGRRVATPPAELDIVGWYGETLVALEVKSSRRSPGRRSREEPLGQEQRRAQLAALAWLARRLHARHARLDLVEVRLHPGHGLEVLWQEELERVSTAWGDVRELAHGAPTPRSNPSGRVLE